MSSYEMLKRIDRLYTAVLWLSGIGFVTALTNLALLLAGVLSLVGFWVVVAVTAVLQVVSYVLRGRALKLEG